MAMNGENENAKRRNQKKESHTYKRQVEDGDVKGNGAGNENDI